MPLLIPILLLCSALASDGRGRVAIPPIDLGVGATARSGVTAGPAFDLGVILLQKDSWSMRAGLAATGSRWAPILDEVVRGSAVQRSLASTRFDLAPRYRITQWLRAEVLVGFSWQSWRQQWVTISSQAVPQLGVGAEAQLSWFGLRGRATTDLSRVELLLSDGTRRKLSPVEIGVTLFIRIPGTRDPFGELPTLPR